MTDPALLRLNTIHMVCDHVRDLSRPGRRWEMLHARGLDYIVLKGNQGDYVAVSWDLIKDAETPEEFNMAIGICRIAVKQPKGRSTQ